MRLLGKGQSVKVWFHPLRFKSTLSTAGGLPIQEYIRRQGRPLQWLLNRCLNRYHVMTSQSKASEAQVIELLEKINLMMEANRCPWEIQHRMYTQMRQDLSIKEETRWQGGQEETRMAVLNYDRPKERQQMALGWPNMPKGKSEL